MQSTCQEELAMNFFLWNFDYLFKLFLDFEEKTFQVFGKKKQNNFGSVLWNAVYWPRRTFCGIRLFEQIIFQSLFLDFEQKNRIFCKEFWAGLSKQHSTCTDEIIRVAETFVQTWKQHRFKTGTQLGNII